MSALTKSLWLAGAVWLGISLTQRVPPVLHNDSLSLPKGLYLIKPHDTSRGALLSFCPPPTDVLKFRPLWKEQGMVCATSQSRFIKPVAAVAGDLVQTSRDGVRVNGVLLPNSAPKDKGLSGKQATPYPFGTYEVEKNTVWVVSSHHPYSYDSRYFGPISTKNTLTYWSLHNELK